MKAAALLLLLLLTPLACSPSDGVATRGARPVKTKHAMPARFDRAQSSGFFVGVRTFDDPTLQSVMYAVDDAVDLAYTFSLERNVALVAPQNVVLAISGEPVKEESRERLRKLLVAGARQTTATREQILQHLRKQAARTGPDGILIAAFASHGFMTGGMQYVLTTTSAFGSRGTSVPAATIFDIAATANRSLILIDACRERTEGATRGPRPNAQNLMNAPLPLLQRMPGISGQVVLYAGGYAYDDHKKKNGAFTSAVLDCLRCDMQRDARGVVTAETLAASVEKRVLKWINDHHDPTLKSATQVMWDVDAKGMPLASCAQPPEIQRVRTSGSTAIALDANGGELWRRDVPGATAGAEAADLDGDALNEAIVSGTDRIAAFDTDGQRIWTASTPSLRSFLTADLFRTPQMQVVAVAGSRLMIIDDDGTLLSTYAHAGELRHVVVERETSHHAPRIVAVDDDGTIFMLAPKRAADVRKVWQGKLRPASAIRGVEITDRDKDGHREITIRTEAGKAVLAFDGHLLDSDGARFVMSR